MYIIPLSIIVLFDCEIQELKWNSQALSVQFNSQCCGSELTFPTLAIFLCSVHQMVSKQTVSLPFEANTNTLSVDGDPHDVFVS